MNQFYRSSPLPKTPCKISSLHGATDQCKKKCMYHRTTFTTIHNIQNLRSSITNPFCHLEKTVLRPCPVFSGYQFPLFFIQLGLMHHASKEFLFFTIQITS